MFQKAKKVVLMRFTQMKQGVTLKEGVGLEAQWGLSLNLNK